MMDDGDAEAIQEISMSIEDTNKLRESLGLKPLRLTEDKDSKEKSAEDNYAQYKSNLVKQRQEKELKEKIEKFSINLMYFMI